MPVIPPANSTWTGRGRIALPAFGSSRPTGFLSLAVVFHWQPGQVQPLHVLEQLMHSLAVLHTWELSSSIVRRYHPETPAVPVQERRVQGSVAIPLTRASRDGAPSSRHATPSPAKSWAIPAQCGFSTSAAEQQPNALPLQQEGLDNSFGLALGFARAKALGRMQRSQHPLSDRAWLPRQVRQRLSGRVSQRVRMAAMMSSSSLRRWCSGFGACESSKASRTSAQPITSQSAWARISEKPG